MTEQDWRARFNGLRASAEQLEPSEAKVMALEEAARLADTHGEAVLAFETRDALIEAAVLAGFPERALVAYAWCRGQQKKDPRRFDPESLLWKQKWMVGVLSEYPHITRAQIAAALDDVEQGYQKAGAGERAVWKLRYVTALDMGDAAQAETLRARWLETPRDYLTDCLACELNVELNHFREKGDHARLLEKARPLLEGRQTCAKVPHSTFGKVLYPLFKRGEWERAREHHLRGYALVRGDRYFVATVGEHLEFLALTGNVTRGLKLLERHLGWALEHTTPLNRFLFYSAALALLDRAGVEQREHVELDLPRAFPLYSAGGRYETGALKGWFAARTEELAAKFDARNGTDRFQRLLARTRGLAAEARPLPIEALE